MTDTKYYRRAALEWPLTPEQLQSVNAELDALYQQLNDARFTIDSAVGVVAGTYGDATDIPQITVNAQGFITSIVNIPIGSALTEVNDTNVTLTLGGTPATALLQAVSLTLGWTGTLAAGRLNANVVQSVVNDTNITGSIAAQALTLGWTGTLAIARGGTGAATLAAAGIATGSGTTGKLTKWSNGPSGVLADSVATEASGNIGIGGSPTSDWAGSTFAQVTGATFGTASIASTRTDGASLRIGSLAFENLTNNATFRTQAVIESLTPVSGTANKRGGDLLFYTQADNVAGPVERMRILSNGNVGIGVTGPIQALDVSGNVHVSAGSTIYSAGRLFIRSGPATTLDLGANDANSLVVLGTSGKFTTYANVATVGWGVPAIYQTGRITGQTTGGVTVFTFSVPAADSSYFLAGVTTITAYTSGSVGLQVTWTGEDGTANTVAFNGLGSGVQQITSGVTQIRAKASTTITVKSSAGPFSLTYNAEAYLLQIG